MESVLVVGHVTHDHTDRGLEPGGGAYYGSKTYQALGAGVRLATAVGEDFLHDAALQGLSLAALRAGRTTQFRNRYRHDGTRVQHVEFRADDVPPGRHPPTDLLHLAPVIGEIDLAAWKTAVRARFVGITIQGWTRAVDPSGLVIPHRWTMDPATLDGVDAACLADEDIQTQEDVFEILCASVPTVVRTRGVHGADVVSCGQAWHVGVYATTEVDPTGAGDAFAAALFLALAQGAPGPEAAQRGAAAGSVAVEGHGGESLGRMDEVAQRASRIPVRRVPAPRPVNRQRR